MAVAETVRCLWWCMYVIKCLQKYNSNSKSAESLRITLKFRSTGWLDDGTQNFDSCGQFTLLIHRQVCFSSIRTHIRILLTIAWKIVSIENVWADGDVIAPPIFLIPFLKQFVKMNKCSGMWTEFGARHATCEQHLSESLFIYIRAECFVLFTELQLVWEKKDRTGKLGA